jgi:hypothetical protein
LQKSIRRSSEYDVIDIEEEVGNVGGGVKNEKRRIRFGGNKTDLSDKICKSGEPSSRSLL